MLRSLFARALLAVALMLGFYVLALSLAAVLLYIPYAELVYLHRVHPKLTLICLAAAGAILWSILPRIDRFTPPGPELLPAAHPELFQLIGCVAQATAQAPPAHVYATLEVNAWVTERGGIMGFGARRVMGLGLPLLQGLTVPELRAVVAHEFGHYHRGDTRLGPWIYKTRAAIERSLASLDPDSWLRLPFVAYSRLFLRLTSAVSRHQEFAADALAARIAGPAAVASGLRKLAGLDAAFNGFWDHEFAPILLSARRPPLAAGFAAFLAHPCVAESLRSLSAEPDAVATANPYDTHPPTSARCAAVEALPPVSAPADPRPATALLAALDDLERQVLDACVRLDLQSAQPLPWADVPEQVWIARWRDELAAHPGLFTTETVAGLADLAADPSPIAGRIRFNPGILPSPEDRRAAAHRLLGLALGVALHHAGWTVSAAIADPLTFHHAAEQIDPLVLITELAADTPLRAAWPARAQSLAIAGLPLAPPCA